ncbi:MAG: DUF4347 domain-containing protein, partial [Planctomycetaceae bacterium]|nr:DUF4347 domain-containing protein [Planctomycetaceae bacterium]
MSLSQWIRSLTKATLNRRNQPTRRKSGAAQSLQRAALQSEMLENRTLLSGDPLDELTRIGEAGAVTDAGDRTLQSEEVPQQHSQSADVSLEVAGQENLQHMLAIVDGGIDGYEAIVDAIGTIAMNNAQMEIVVLDPDLDGVDQISRILSHRTDIDALHLFSHGSSGAIRLGTTTLDSAALEAMSDTMAGWGQSLTENADILLYGCEIGEGLPGIEFLHAFSATTGADVSASIDLTGDSQQGGDWDLEATTGSVETPPLFDNAPPAFHGVLSTITGSQLIAANGDFNGQTIDATTNPTVVDTLNLTGVTGNLTITLSKASGAAKVNIVISRSENSVTSTVTYVLAQGRGGVPNILAGNNATQRLIFTLNRVGIGTLDLSTLSNVQVAIGKSATNVHGEITRGGSAEIICRTAGIDTLLIGRVGSVGDVMDIAILDGAQLATLKKKSGYNGKLNLSFPDSLNTSNLDKIDAKNIATIPLPTGTRADGFTTANLNKVQAGKGDQVIDAGSIANLTADAGEGDDFIVAGAGNQTLIGGPGNDSYEFKGLWGDDTVTELVTGGTGDKLDFSAIASGITVDLYRSDLSSGLSGVQVVSNTNSANRLVNAKYIEAIVGPNADNTYRFNDAWGFQSTTLTTSIFNIDDSASGDTLGTLDFSKVTHDLDYVIESNGVITVTARVTHTVTGGPREFTYIVKAKNIASVIGGKGDNTWHINSDTALQGGITSSATGRNFFDYSDYSGTAPVVIDTVAGVATGLMLSTAPASNQELQTFSIGNAATGTFRLGIGSIVTEPITLGSTTLETRNNIQLALDKLAGPNLFEVLNATSNSWRVRFGIAANHPVISLNTSGLRDGVGNPVTGSVTTNQAGRAPFGTGGFDRLEQIVGGPSNTDMVVLYGTVATGGSKRDIIYTRDSDAVINGTSGSDILVTYAGNDTVDGGAGDDQISGGNGTNTLRGGSGNDSIYGGSGIDNLYGDAGDDLLEGAAGNDSLQGGPGNDILNGGAGDDSLQGGVGDDTYILTNGWGSDTIVEANVDGKDTIDFGQVTNDLSFVLSDGKLVAGSGTVTIENKPGYFTGYRNITGSFSGGDLLTVTRAGSFNEIQAVSLAGASAGSTFTLTLSDALNNLNFNRTITVGADDAATAANIQTALNAALGADSVKVIVGSVSTFHVEFLKPGNTDISAMVLGTTGLTWPAVPTPVSLQEAAVGKNAIWQIDLGMTNGGSISLGFNNGTARTASSISVTNDPQVTAANIQAAIASSGGAGASAKVSVAGMGIYKIEFTGPSATAVTGGTITASLTYPTGVTVLQHGQSGADIQQIDLTNVASGSFTLKIGSQETGPVTWSTTPATTADRIRDAINATSQGFKGLFAKFKVSVKGTGTANDQTFEVTFLGPKDKDVADISVNTADLLASSGNVSASVTSLQNGQSGGGPSAIETVIAPNADTTMYFGNEIINSIGDVAKQALIPAELRNYGELTIDSSTLTSNGHQLTLDFSNVTRPMEFVFENTAKTEIQQLILNATESPVGSKFRLQVGSVTTGDITVQGKDSLTARAIQLALNSAFTGTSLDGVTVKVATSLLTSGKYEITYSAFQDVPLLTAVQDTATGSAQLSQAATSVLREGVSGKIQLTIEKTYQWPELFEGSYVAELWNELWGQISYDKVVITNVDSNTTIIGGKNENTFKIQGDATFAGKIVGLKALRPLTSFLDYESLTGAVTLDFPNINTINTLDMSDSLASQPTVVNLTHLVNDGAVNSQTVTEAQDGREVQRLVIPTATYGKFVIEGFQADGVTTFESSVISLHNEVGGGATLTYGIVSPVEIASRIEQALNTALGEATDQGVKVAPVAIVNTDGTKSIAYDVTFQRSGVNYKPLEINDVLAAGVTPVKQIVALTAANVTPMGTPNASAVTVDLTAVTGVTNVRLQLTTDSGLRVTTASTPQTVAGLKAAIDEIVVASNLLEALGPVAVTSNSADTYNISFPRGNVAISVLNAADDTAVADATVTVTQFAQKKNRVQKLTFNGATSGIVDVGYSVARPGQAPLSGKISLDLNSANLATTLENAFDSALTLGDVSVTGDLASGLIVTFETDLNDVVFVRGEVRPLTLTARTAVKPASAGSTPVGPVDVVLQSIVHEVQRLTLTDAVSNTPATGIFRLTVTDPATSSAKTTADIAIGTTTEATATNIQAALNAITVLGTNATMVNANPAGGWDIEYLLPGNIASAAVSTQPTGGTIAVTTLTEGSTSNNSVQKFHLNAADAGSFAFRMNGELTLPVNLQSGTATAIGTIDGFAVAGRIKTELERLKNLTTVNVKAYRTTNGLTTLLTGSAAVPAGEVHFEVEIVSPDSTLGFEKLSIEAGDLLQRHSAPVDYSVITVHEGRRAVSEVQKLSRLDTLKSGSNFQLAYDGGTSEATAYTTTAIQASYDSLTPSAGYAQVVGTDANTWLVTFTGNMGGDESLSGMITDNASQLAQKVPFSDLRHGKFGNTPGATGFTGIVQNMSNINYGAGVNLLLGSNVSIYEALLAQKAPAISKSSLFSDASFSLGKNVFSVGGNLLSTLFDDGRTGDGRFSGEGLADVAKFVTDTLTNTLLSGELSFGEPTIAPGVHLMSGLTGGDTYKFEGFWGAAAIVEPPSVYAGVDLNLGFDTLDMSAVSGDVTFDIYTLSTDNIGDWQARLNALGHPMPLSIGMTLVLARNNAGTKFIEQFASAVGGSVDVDGFGLNYIIATGIENIIGSGGENTFKFHGNARLDGYVAAGTDGEIKFDYSDYTPSGSTVINGNTYDGVVVDGTAGLSFGIPGTEAPLPILGTFAGANVNWGSATGVLGSRLVGLDLLVPGSALGSFAPTNNAVDGLKSAVGTAQSDYLQGNDEDNVFTVGHGGNDFVDGGEHKKDGDTVSFEGTSNDTFVDLKNGVAHTGLSAGTVQFARHSVLALGGNHGSFTLTHETNVATITAGQMTATGIQTALEGLASISSGDIRVVDLGGGSFDIQFLNFSLSTAIAVNVADLKTRTSGSVSYTSGTGALVVTGNAGTFVLTHQTNDATIHITDDAATIQSTLEGLATIGSGNVTVSGTAGNYTIAFLNGVDATLSTDASNLFTDVNGTGTYTPATLPKLTIDADAGLFTLTHAGNRTARLQFDASAEAIQQALDSLASLHDDNDATVSVTVTATDTAGVFTIAFGTGVTAQLLSTDADPGSSDGAGLLKVEATTTSITLGHIENIQDGEGNDLLTGDDGDNVFYFSDDSGKNLVYGGDGDNKLDFSKVTDDVTVTEAHGGLVITWGENRVTAFGNFEVDGIGARQAGAIKDLFSKKLLGGDLELGSGGTPNSGTSLSSGSDVAGLLTEAVSRWNAILPSVLDLDGSQINVIVGDLGSTIASVAWNATSSKYDVTLDDNAAGGGWYVDTAFTGSTADDEFSTAAPNGVDALTVLMHELGHIVGIDHPAVADSGNLMNSTLRKGVRLNPATENVATGLTSEDAFAAGLDLFGDWAQNLGTRISDTLENATTIPFTDISLAQILGITEGVDAFGSMINTKVDSIALAIDSYFSTNSDPNTNDMLLALQALSSNGIHVSATPGIQQYNVTIDLATWSKSIVLDLSDLSIDLSSVGIDAELPFNFGLSTTQSQPIQLTAGVYLDFEFGIDNQGQFYVLDPEVSAGVELGEIQQNIIGVDVDAKTFTIAGDATTLPGHVNSDNGHYVAGDRIAVSGSTGNNNIYTVATATYDVFTDTTIITVTEDIADETADGSLIKTMDFGVNLGPLGLESNDAVLSLGISAGIGLDYKLNMLELQQGSDAYSLITSLSPSLGEDSHYTIVLPIEWAGVLDGILDGTGYVTATSAMLQPGTTIAGFLAAIPSTIQISGMSDLLKFSGLSLDTILAALEDTADDLVGTDRQLHGQFVGGSVDADGEFTGGIFKVFGEVWRAGTPVALTSSYTPVETNGDQNAIIVEDMNGDKLRLSEWSFGGNSVYGIAVPVNANDFELTVYTLDHYRIVQTYSADDVALNLVTADALTGVQLDNGSSTSAGNLSLVRVRDGELYNDIPMLGVSLADVLGEGAVSFAAGFGDAIGTIREKARNIKELESELNAEINRFFNFTTPVDFVTLAYNNGAFDFDFDFSQAIERTYNLELDIDQLNLKQWLGFDPGEFLDLSLTAPVSVSASVAMHLGFGFDLSNVFEPSFYVDADTGISASVVGAAPDVDAKLSIDIPAIGSIDLPPIGLYVIDGSAEIRADFYANFGDPVADEDGDGRISPFSLKSAFQAELSGSAVADLPIYFPTTSMPLGGTTEDSDGNGVADNALHAEASFSVDETFTLQTDYSYSLPNISMKFDAVQAIIAFIDNAENVLHGMEGFFDGIDKVANGIDSIELPVIGGSAFDSLANKIRSIRTSVLGPKSAGVYTDGLGKWLQDQGSNSIIDAVLNEIRQELFDGFTQLNLSTNAVRMENGELVIDRGVGALFAFVVPDLDEHGAKQFDETGKVKVKVPLSADEIQLAFSENGLLTFNLMFGGTLVDGKLPVEFGVGIPGVSLDVDIEIQTKIDYLMGIGLGIGNVSRTSVPQIGFFVDTSGINAQGEELALDVSAELGANDTASGTLGFLAMNFAQIADQKTGLWGHFGVNIQDADGDGKWKIGEGVSLQMNASAFAEAHLSAAVGTTAGSLLPSVRTNIHYTQLLGQVTLSTNGKASFDFGSPDVILENVTVNVGSLFSSFLSDTLNTIYDVVKPLKPVVDLLLMEIPLGGIANPPIRFIDIARLRLPAKVVDNMTKVLQVVKSTIEFLETVSVLSAAGDINFGTFHLTENTLENPDAELNESDAASTGTTSNSLTTAQKNALKGPDQKGLDTEQSTKSAASKAKKRSSGKNFQIPVLEDPMSLLDFIMGRGEVDLFWYDLPDLNLVFDYSRSFPVFGPLNVGLFGRVAATTNFDFGFDTRGLSQWKATGFDPAESWRIFNGFYLDDHGQENTPGDQPELTLNAAIGASVSLGIGGLVEAGVRGGLEAEITFDLNDFETQILNDLPVGDGKLYGSELIDRLGHGIECLFDVSGQLSVFLEAYLWIGVDLGFSTITLFKASKRFVDEVIARFDWECIHDAPTYLSQLTDGVLNLQYQDGNRNAYPAPSGYRYNVTTLDIDENLTLASLLENGFFDPEYTTRDEEVALRDKLAGYRTDNDGEKVVVVSNGQKVDVYLASEVDSISSTGTSARDMYTLKELEGSVSSLTFNLGDGDDTVVVNAVETASGSGLTSITINGGAGADNILVDASNLKATGGTYVLSGDAGNDRISITGSHADYSGVIINGGTGDDKLFGGDGPEEIYGGVKIGSGFDGFDLIIGNDGNDILDGGDEFEGDGTA